MNPLASLPASNSAACSDNNFPSTSIAHKASSSVSSIGPSSFMRLDHALKLYAPCSIVYHSTLPIALAVLSHSLGLNPALVAPPNNACRLSALACSNLDFISALLIPKTVGPGLALRSVLPG